MVREELPRDRFGDRAKRYQVVVGYNRSGKESNGSCSGYAHYNSNWCTVNIPSGNVDPADFAYVVGHEVGHSKGLRHGRMAPHHTRSDYSRVHYAWAAALTISRKRVKAKERATADKKLAHAERMLKAAATRAKRAATLLKKWRAKVRYYERQTALRAGKIAACEKAPEVLE